MWRSHVSCPQADVACTVGALFVAKPRCLVILCCRPRDHSVDNWQLTIDSCLRRSRGIFYRNNIKNRYANLLGTAEQITKCWISALIGIIPNSFGTAERISKMPFLRFFTIVSIFQRSLRGSAANPHLIAFSLSPYSLQQQCCGFYVVASLEVQCDILR